MHRYLTFIVLSIIAMTATARPTLVFNINGYTWESDGIRRFDALLIDEQGRVVAADRLGVLPKVPDVLGVDGGGATLLPGLIDAHGHVLDLGRMRQRLDLRGTKSLGEALSRIREHTSVLPEDEWVLGRGWNQELWEPAEFPTAADLDRVVGDRAVWLTRIDGHAGWASSRAMELAAISAETPDPPDGVILRYPDRAPSGIFVDAAEDLIQRVITPPSLARDRAALETALRELNRVGLTAVHDAGVDARTIRLYRELADAGRLSVRIYAMLTPETLAEFERPVIGYADDRLSVRSVKVYVDGALGSRGAALSTPYRDDPGNRGLLFRDQPELATFIREASTKGFQTCVHAIGDRANRVVLDAFDSAQEGGRSSLRNRVEHAQVVHRADIPRFRELGLVASMQPIHATSDMAMAVKRLSAQQLAGAYAWRSFLDNGVVVAAGSDFPVESANPFHGIHAAVTRQNQDDDPRGGWRRQEAMSVAEALRAFTTDAAYAALLEDRVGSLEAGKWADFVLIDRDPFAAPSRELWQVQVLETWLGGERVYRRDSGRDPG